MRFSAGATALALAGALALGGCGGGDSESASRSSEATTAQAPKAQAPEPKPQAHDGGSAASQQDGAGSQEAAPTTHAEGNPVPPGQSQVTPGDPGNPTPGAKAPAPGVPVIPKGDNSIQTFGEEGQDTEREQATAELEAYLDARAEGNWAAACEATSAQYKSQLAKAVSRTPDDKEPKGCAETLALLYGKAPLATLEQAAQIGEVLSFRIRDDGYAYLIFKDPQGAVKFIAMANDGGTWKVNTPEPQAFQASQGEAQ